MDTWARATTPMTTKNINRSTWMPILTRGTQPPTVVTLPTTLFRTFLSQKIPKKINQAWIPILSNHWLKERVEITTEVMRTKSSRSMLREALFSLCRRSSSNHWYWGDRTMHFKTIMFLRKWRMILQIVAIWKMQETSKWSLLWMGHRSTWLRNRGKL